MLTSVSDDYITKNGLCRDCGMCGLEWKCILCFGKEVNSEDKVVDGRIIFKYFKVWDWRWWSGLM